jgi:hypothetical protein
MGITIANHKHSIDMGAGGFARLRITISKLLNCKEFADLYTDLSTGGQYRYAEKGFSSMDEYFEDHDRKALSTCEANKLDEEVVNFLYRSDCDCSSVSVKTCRHLWRFIKDYDDDIVYGYVGRPDRAMFRDFKQIIKECVDDRRVMKIS